MKVFLERVACPGCECEKSASLFCAPFSDSRIQQFLKRKFRDPRAITEVLGEATYELRKCAACTLIYQRKVLTDEYSQLLYGKWLLEGDAEPELSKERLGPSEHALYANELLMVGRFFGRPHHLIRLLDYGLGRGWWCRMATALGFEAVGTDLAPALVADARARGITAIDLGELESERFDFINTEQVLEHVTRPLEVVRRLSKALRSGGVIKVSVPDGRGIERRIPLMDWTAPRADRRYLMPATPLIHVNTFNRESIVAMGRAAGLKEAVWPLRLEYSLIDGSAAKPLLKSLLRPLYRRALRTTYVFLRSDS
jgi:2-polyprenyl-3-methyl-5-hydroxy-6-metoxy-1,4-benzoquinol methylase